MEGDTYVEELAQLGVGEVCHLRVQRADLHVALLYNQFSLAQSFLGNQVAVVSQLGLEVCSGGRREQVQQGEHLCVLLGQLLHRGQLQQLSEVDHVDGLYRENHATARVCFSVDQKRRVRTDVQLEVCVQHFKGAAGLVELVEGVAHLFVEVAAFLFGEVPVGGLGHDFAGAVDDDVAAVFAQTEIDQLFKGEGLDARVGVRSVKELDEGFDLDLEGEVGLLDQQVDELDSQIFGPPVVALLCKRQQWPQKQEEALDGALGLLDGDGQLQDHGALLEKQLQEEERRVSLALQLETLENAFLEVGELFGVLGLLFEVVGHLRGQVDADVAFLTRDLLGVEIRGDTAEGRGELVDKEGGDLGEAGSVALSVLRKEIHFLVLIILLIGAMLSIGSWAQSAALSRERRDSQSRLIIYINYCRRKGINTPNS